jgi:isocitrate dehydrogenase
VKTLVGVDVFIDLAGGKADDIASRLGGSELRLAAVMNRGTKVWPDGLPETFCTDQWRLRFKSKTANGNIKQSDIAALLGWIAGAGFDSIKTENLYAFDGAPGYSVVQGE